MFVYFWIRFIIFIIHIYKLLLMHANLFIYVNKHQQLTVSLVSLAGLCSLWSCTSRRSESWSSGPRRRKRSTTGFRHWQRWQTLLARNARGTFFLLKATKRRLAPLQQIHPLLRRAPRCDFQRDKWSCCLFPDGLTGSCDNTPHKCVPICCFYLFNPREPRYRWWNV